MNFFRKRSAIGVDFGTRHVKAVQLERTRTQGVRIAAALSMPRRAGATDAETFAALDEAFVRLGFTGRHVVVACPAEALRSEVFELPTAAPGVPVARIAEAEMRRLTRLDSASFEMSYWPLPASARASSSTASTVMAVAALDAETDAFVSRFESAGLDVVAVDAHACALARAAQSLSLKGLLVIAELGASAATIALAHDGRVVYQRAVADAGLDILRGSIGADLRLDDDEADCVLARGDDAASADASLAPKHARLRSLIVQHAETIAREIEGSVAFATHRYPSLRIAGVSLAGGGARIAGLVREIAARLPHVAVPVAPAQLGFAHPQLAVDSNNPQLLAALGLALNDFE